MMRTPNPLRFAFAAAALFGLFAAIALLQGERTVLAAEPPSDKDISPPALSRAFLEYAVFLSVDIQPGTKRHLSGISEGWKKAGYTLEDCNAAIDFYYDTARPNAVKIANACREARLPMIFVHWGYQFKDGMDLDPRIYRSFVESLGPDTSRWPHYIGSPDSRPAEEFAVREGEYVIAKTGQDAFTSSNLRFVLENLGAKRIIFIGGHANPGGCLGQTAVSARKAGYEILVIHDATYDAGESTRLPGLRKAGFHHSLSTQEFLQLVHSSPVAP